MLPEFEYYRPSSVKEAVDLLSRLGPEARVIAGGTDLIVKMRGGLIKPKCIVDITRLDEIKFIRDEGEVIRVGAGTLLSDIEESEIIGEGVPVLREAVKKMASWHVKNMATIGGNLCNASPAADTAPPLIVHEARLKIRGPGGEREVPVEEFFTGPGETVLMPGELLTEIIVPKARPGEGASFQKLMVREGALAIVSAAALVKLDGGTVSKVRVALGAVAPTPVRAKHVESALQGREPTPEVLREASKEVLQDISPITDVRGSREYRLEMSVVMTRRALEEAIARAGG